jgi:phospholipid/cholesterol/gamma-HCH transport system ATP-binding protein
VKYGERTVLDGINLTVKRGEVFVILGGSGCGKSTLLRNLVGLMRPHSGRILINGPDVTALSDAPRIAARNRMGL